MPTLPPYIAGWVGLLLFAAVMPGLWRGVFGALAALGWGTVADARPRALLGDGLFAVIVGGVCFALYLLIFQVTRSLMLVLVAPELSVAGGAVCLVVAARRWDERERRRPPEAGRAAEEAREAPAASEARDAAPGDLPEGEEAAPDDPPDPGAPAPDPDRSS